MEEESAVVLHFLPQKTKCVDGAAARLGVGNVAALVADAQCGQPEASRGDACQIALIRLAHITAVPDEASIRVRLFPEIPEISSFQFFQECVVAGGEIRVNGRRGRMLCRDRLRWQGEFISEAKPWSTKQWPR